MKRHFSLLFLTLLCISLYANPVDIELARKIGTLFVNAHSGEKLASTDALRLAKTYRTASGASAFHVFNYPQGFVVIAADDCAYPVLAFSDEVPFDADDIAPAMEEYLQAFVEQIEWGIAEGHHDETTDLQWQNVQATGNPLPTKNAQAVTPLLPDVWNQNCYYNDYCPVDAAGPCGHCYVGCTSLAMGQIMHYWAYPEHGSGSVTYTPPGYPQQSVDFGQATYNWANMPNEVTQNTPQNQRAETATLLWHIGVSMQANYGPNGTSGVPAYTAEKLITYWRYSTDCHNIYKNDFSTDQWIVLLKNDLDAGRPIHYSGWTSNNSGHSFVCDGYNDSDQFHFNWGWSGSGNGYFAIGALNVGSYQFNYNNLAVVGIHPLDGTQYTVTTAANPSNGGTATGGGSFSYGQSCTVHATANTGFQFVNWTENGTQVSTSANYTFTVTANRNLVANFSSVSYTVTTAANPSNGGTATGGGSFSYGQSCTVHATANTGFQFVNWTENGTQVSTSANYTFTVTANRNLVANFSSVSYTVTTAANPSNGGTATGGGSFSYGQSCTVHATANTGFQFVNWTENGTQVSTSANYTFTVTANRNLVANFSPVSYTVTTAANPSNGGTATGGGSFSYGQSCTVHATANTGFQFVNWTENGTQVSTSANYTFTVTANRNLVANFSPVSYTVTTAANPSNGGTATGGGSFSYGQSCTVHATANTGFQFVNWTENGTQVSTSANYTFTVTANRNLVANFSPVSYTVTTAANPSNGGTATGGGSFSYGQSCTVTATALNHNIFTNWTEDGQIVSNNASYTFTVTGDRCLVANFTPQMYHITASTNPDGSGTINGVGDYPFGEVVTLSVLPATFYLFENWTENEQIVSTEPTFTFTVESDRHFIANLYYFDQVEEVSEEAYRVYPNPAQDHVIVEGDGIREVKVYNLYGQLLSTQKPAGDEAMRLDFNAMHPSSLYFVLLYTDFGVITKRVVRSR